ncbi:3-hydroxypropionyl-coenzyme A dehydratase [Geodia barretti]|uniref:3-hydroxypropionyl-coenzyme A dehydratase n=1 Tax=Geodia barretti TaxID=519541 RepID=A0AA35TXM0_GEOBA|nr:3-hydroxypropionyl-coenzyme A dehydratase [Geodia barretti]
MVVRSYELLSVERTGHVATITLNRPEKLNALNPPLVAEFHAALDEIASEEDIRVVIVTGAGRGFCSGADVNRQLESLQGTADPAPEGPGITALAPHLQRIPQPVIAAINGVSAGAGFGVALASDIRIASEAARFSCIFAARQGAAMEMALTGSIYDAQWALEKGLVNKVVPADRLLDAAMELAQTIASNPPICVRSIKQLVHEHDGDIENVLHLESAANASAYCSEDRLEAVKSFLEKREPVYKGR